MPENSNAVLSFVGDGALGVPMVSVTVAVHIIE